LVPSTAVTLQVKEYATPTVAAVKAIAIANVTILLLISTLLFWFFY